MSRIINSLTLEETVEVTFEDPELSLVQLRNQNNLLSEQSLNRSAVKVKGKLTVSF